MKKRWAAQKKAASRELDATVLQTKGGPKRNLPISR
jgi:hypothetical protein